MKKTKQKSIVKGLGMNKKLSREDKDRNHKAKQSLLGLALVAGFFMLYISGSLERVFMTLIG